jgi:hypothetical protein
LAALADRTTRCEGGPPPDEGLLPHLRVIVARVLRTGRGPADLLNWVGRQLADHPPPSGDVASHLAGRLLARLWPPTPTVLETVTD